MRIRTVIVLALCLMASAIAQSEPAAETLSLESAVELAEAKSQDVAQARLALEAAERMHAINLADPLAVRLDQLRSEHAVAAAAENLQTVIQANRTNTLNMYTSVLTANARVIEAELELSIASTALQAQQLRFDAGAITRLELQRADTAKEGAERRLSTAQTNLVRATTELEQATETADIQLAAPDSLGPTTEVPDFQALLDHALGTNAQLNAARRDEQLKAAELRAVNTAFSSLQTLNAARAAHDSARNLITTLESEVESSLQLSLHDLQSAMGNLDSARAELSHMEAELQAQEMRYEAGTISSIELAEARLQHLISHHAYQSAIYSVLQAEERLRGAIR